MTDYEQPDSTVNTELDAPVTDDLISLGDDPAPPKPTEYVPPVKEEPKGAEKKPTGTDEDVCPVCKFVDHLGEIVPAPVHDILVWKDLYKTALIFFTILPLLIMYCYCNPIVVTAYLLLGLVTATFTYRAYRYVLDSFQKSEVVHPFKDIGDLEVETTRKIVLQWADRVLPLFIRFVNRMKHYILVEDILDTAKFAVVLYATAVVGGFFSLRLLFILGFVGAFTLPKVYAQYKTQINDFSQKTHVFIKAQVVAAKKKMCSLKEQAMNAAAKKRN